MGETTKEQRDGLRRLAEEATAGPWVRWVDHGTVVAGPVTVNEPGRISGARTTICEVEDDDGWEDDDDLADAGANAEFIAAANPETVLALLNALAASEAAALVVDAQADALLERATAAESALAEARRERDRLVAEWVAQADVYDAEAAPPTRNDDERRTALVKFVTAIALRDCARKLRALTPGADAPNPQTKEPTP